MTPNRAARFAARSASVIGPEAAAGFAVSPASSVFSSASVVFSGDAAAASLGGPPMTVICFLAELSPSPGPVTETKEWLRDCHC